jgi:hypothetical protein
MKTLLIYLCLTIFIGIKAHSQQNEILNKNLDFGFTKGFVSRMAITNKNDNSIKWNKSFYFLFYAIGEESDHKANDYPHISYDPDILFGVSGGIGPQLNLGEHFFTGIDFTAGFAMSGVKVSYIEDYGTYLNKIGFYYDWVPSVFNYNTAYFSFSTLDKEGTNSFMARIGISFYAGTSKEQIAIGTPISFSAGFGF